jgi:hypothetical protein
MIKSLKLVLNFYGMHFVTSEEYPIIRRVNDYWDRYSVLIQFVNIKHFHLLYTKLIYFLSEAAGNCRLKRLLQCLSIFEMETCQLLILYFLFFEIYLTKELAYPDLMQLFEQDWLLTIKNKNFKKFFLYLLKFQVKF